MKPLVLCKQDTLQLTYDVPHRILSSKVYPCQAPNESTIIIYGHGEGLQILWRGGKPLASSRRSKVKANPNGTASKDSMVIDLDDDGPELPKSTPQPAEFEDEDGEIDPSEPYLNILRSVNIPLGTAARHCAVPHIPPHVFQASIGAYPPIYSTHVVVAVACDDLSVRLVSLPLTPPPQDAKDPSAWGLQIVKIEPTSHQDPLSSITITHSSSQVEPDDEVEKGKSRSRSRSQIGNTAATATNSKSVQHWSFLIASVSPTAGGLLLVHQLPSTSDNALSTLPESQVLLQRQYFRSGWISSMIKFNPSPYPSERHSNVLITFPDSGFVKIYQALPDLNSATSRGRRGSAATIDSANSSSRSLPTSATRPGKFLVTLYTGFIELTESVPPARRKRVLDGAWVLGGRAVLVLLEDGEWGVWDVEGAGPASASNQSLFTGQKIVCGIQGGALTRFSFKGFMAPPTDQVPKTQQVEAQDMLSGRLAPMTPHTRQVRSDGLFRGSASRNSSTTLSGRFAHGCISVTEYRPANLSTATPTNESILLSLGNTNLLIPSLLSLWRAESTGKGSLDSSGIIRPYPFTALHLGGEQQRSIAALSRPSNATASALLGPRSAKMADVLISTDNRLIMLVSPISEPKTSSAFAHQGSGTSSGRTDADQLLLIQGDLDIDGMDRILDSMTNGNSKGLARSGKSMEFDLDEDGDVGMGTPTPKNHGRLARAGATPGATRSDRTRRELVT